VSVLRAIENMICHRGPEGTSCADRSNKRFVLLSCLLLTILVTLPLGLALLQYVRTGRQQDALRNLAQFGADGKWNFGDVVSLHFQNGDRRCDDTVIPLLAPFCRLKLLGMCESDVTDNGLAGLALLNLADLESLSLLSSKVTDRGLSQLLRFRGLKRVSLSGTGVTDNGLRILSQHRRLEALYLPDTAVTDEGLRAICMMKLRALSVAGTSVSDSGVPDLARITPLEELNVSNTRITDRSLQTISFLANLRAVYLRGTCVSDRGLRCLHRLRNLRMLDVQDTKVTAAGVSEFKTAAPRVVILHTTGLTKASSGGQREGAEKMNRRIKGSGCVGTSRREVANERVVQGKT
jgi:internalin A